MRRKNIAVAVAIGLLVGISLLHGEPSGSEADSPQTADLIKAISLSITKLQSTVKSPSDYKLIKAELMCRKGKYTWLVTYKLGKLLPEDPSKEPIGAGGEIFLDVDLGTEQVEVRHGE